MKSKGIILEDTREGVRYKIINKIRFKMRNTAGIGEIAELEHKITIGNNTLERWMSQHPYAVRGLLQEMDYFRGTAEQEGLSGAPGIEYQLRRYSTLRSSAVRKLGLVNL